MRRSFNVGLALVLALPWVAGCQNNEQAFGGAGAAVGALACGVIGNAIFHNAAGTVGSAAACGVAGFFVGSSIGRQMDERDRQRAAAATQQALAEPIHYPPTRTTALHPPVRRVNWSSDHASGVHGSSNLVEVQPEHNGGECRVVREIAYIKGAEQTQESKYCRSPGGDWVSA